MLLADEFFLIAHDDATGRARLNPRATGLGLAGGLLAELVLMGHVTVHGGQVAVVDRRPPQDALAHTVLDQLIAEPGYRAVRVWLAFLASHSVDAVGQRLERAGHATRVKARWRRGTRYVPVDMSTAAWPEHRLRLLFARGELLTMFDAALAGLVAATGLTARVLWDVPAAAHLRLGQVVSTLPEPLHELVAHLEAAVGDAVISHR